MDIHEHNRRAWDRLVERGDRWTVPVGSETIAAARAGSWSVVLTPTRPAPQEWFGDVAGKKILCLASGGGQQGPVLAAAGAMVTMLDQSPAQLSHDALVAAREGLEIETVEGDMAKLSMFRANSFDLIFHPCSNSFVPDVRAVWKEAHRVLKTGGALLAGFVNPINYLFDIDAEDPQNLRVVNSIPYSDIDDLDPTRLQQLVTEQQPLQWSHTLEDQIAGQLAAGFTITGFYEDHHPGSPLAEWAATMIATRAVKGKRRK